ncbi:MAG: bifunctional adenosylcobinamide kinase/adenosylcobinamide-phosphate guanylyltransferase [Rhodospirillaceae bacterium]|nr:bifunctional adenosylcobinamide kinase/adenosylcobinamide-phosphate guanylyltransferase [Rhodospirillaceae bacterium]
MFETTPLPPVSLVLGGARSGKSTLAESWVEAEAKRRDVVALYLATGRAWDAEMESRVATHRARRGAIWETVEEPLAVAACLPLLPPGRPILLDCLTLWVTNHLLEGHDLDAEIAILVDALNQAPGPVVCVSNEVGLGIVPDNALSRAFRDAQGLVNQRVAAVAGHVVFVAAGLPLTLKSENKDCC